LLNAAERDLHIADIANMAGFDHLGRFAHDYSCEFGELPSATLQRVRSQRGRRMADTGKRTAP
jgi:AraC-like DNA-binding protein